MGECAQCSKIFTRNVVWWLNLVFLVAGLGLICSGVFIYVQDVAAWAGDGLAIATFLLGFFILVLSMLALFGASTQTLKCPMWTYIVLLSLLIIAQISVVVVAITMESTAKDVLFKQWNRLSDAQREEFMKQADCGVHNGEEWSQGCGDGDECFLDCYDSIVDELSSVGSVVMIFGVLIAALELTLLFCSFVVVCVDDDEWKAYYGNSVTGGQRYTTERYCGGMSWTIALCCGFPCICFCPVDERQVVLHV